MGFGELNESFKELLLKPSTREPFAGPDEVSRSIEI